MTNSVFVLDRQVGGFLTVENAAGILASEAISVGDVCAVAHQPASDDSLAPWIDRGNRLACRHPDDQITATEEERIGTNHKPACLRLRQRLFTLWIDRGKSVTRRERHDSVTLAE
jgi:hypothetical protein